MPNPQASQTADTSLALESATDVSKFNCDGILLKDDFYWAPKGVEESRALSDCIQRSFYALFALNFAILFVVLGMILVLEDTLSLLQILLINFVFDSAVGIGLALDRSPRSALLKPVRKFPTTLDFTFAFVFAFLIALFSIAAASAASDPSLAASAAATTIIFTSAAALISYVSMDKSLFVSGISPRLIIGVALMIAVLLLVMYVPQLGIFGITALPTEQWTFAIGSAALVLVVSEIKKLVFR